MLKSATPPEKRAPRTELYSVKLALTKRRRTPVLKNYTKNTPLVISLVYSVSVSLPIYMISLMMINLRMKLTTTIDIEAT